ncbi:LysM domain-containing protein, partial [Clavibacter phaseoli]
MTDDQSWQAPGGAPSGHGGSPDPDRTDAGRAAPPAQPAPPY